MLRVGVERYGSCLGGRYLVGTFPGGVSWWALSRSELSELIILIVIFWNLYLSCLQ